MSSGMRMETAGQKLGQFIFWLPMVFCSMEIVPNWGIFNLDWPPEVYFVIMAVCGAAAGALMAPNYRVPGLVVGLLAGPGGLFAVTLLLQNVNSIHTIAIVLVALIGCLPGVGVGFALKVVQDRFAQQLDEGPSARLEDDAERPWPADAPPRLPDDRTMPRDDGMHLRD
jgi:hypothetical protein